MRHSRPPASAALKAIAEATYRTTVAVADILKDSALSGIEREAEMTRLLMETDAVLRGVIVRLEANGKAN